MVNAQEWLDQNYPKEQRKNIKKLKINEMDLEGELDLSDFVNLEELTFSNIGKNKVKKFIFGEKSNKKNDKKNFYESTKESTKHFQSELERIEQKKEILKKTMNNEEEKKLLEELINAYLEYKEVWKQSIPSPSSKPEGYYCFRPNVNDNNWEKEYNEKKETLQKRLGDEKMKEIYSILNDYEKLFEKELEWQKRDMMFWLTGDEKHLKNLENLIEVSPNSQD